MQNTRTPDRGQRKPRHRQGGQQNSGQQNRAPQNTGRQNPESPTPHAAPSDQVTASDTQAKTFDELGLPTPVLRALRENGIAAPFPIQSATLPDALSGRHVLGRGQTGSGKTLAFGLAMLSRLATGTTRSRHPRGLVLVPTRELAQQVADALLPYARALDLWCRCAVGGTSFPRQADALRKGVDLLIATPGRLSDHVRQGTCVLDDIECATLDEADQMADMGFLPQVRAILDLTGPDTQHMLFSATLDGDVDKLVNQYLRDPITHSVAPVTSTITTMEHHLLTVNEVDKPTVLTEIAARDGRTILFVRTKHHVDRITKKLRASGVRAAALHGGKTQGARTRVLESFRSGTDSVLVATDIAARGIHVDGISLVVHVDPPSDEKAYLHRAGRTARAGESGTVVTLLTKEQRRTVHRMADKAGIKASRADVSPGADELARITGAQQPSGVPVRDPEPRERPQRPGRRNDNGRNDNGRNGGGRPGNGGGRPARRGPNQGQKPQGQQPRRNARQGR